MSTKSASKIQPNLMASAKPSAADPTHQLPPAVHAIGGSIGSALAILTFYPLERIRVELQSNSARIELANECITNNDGNIDSSAGKSDCSLDKREVLDDVGDDDKIIQQEEVNHHALDLSDKSFELVSPLKTSADVVSLDTSLEDDQDDIDTALATNEHILHSNTLLDEDLDQVKTPKNPLSKYEPGTRKTSKSHSQENILQCFVRLHKEQTLYKGASHMVITMMVSNAVFFYTLQVIRQRMSSLQQKSLHNQNFLPKSKMGRSLLASSIAGAINVLMTNPLWVASLRIMESKLPQHRNDDRSRKPTLWSVMHQIAAKEGIANLWSGTNTSLLLVSNPIIQHFLYEQLRLWILESRQRRSRSRHTRQQDPRLVSKATSLSPLEALAFGALAKAVATVVTYPLQLAQVLLRLQKKKGNQSPQNSKGDTKQPVTSNETNANGAAYNGTLDCLYQQFTRGGAKALFQGMNAKLLQTVLTAAFTFLTYEQTLEKVARVYSILGLKL